MKRSILVILVFLLLGGCARAGRQGGEYSRTEPLMGTFVQVRVIAPGRSAADLKRSVDGALEAAGDLEKKFSVFDPESEVNALNIAGELKASPDLFGLIDEAAKVSRITKGEFDITVSPVLKADGFYASMPEEIRDKVPEDLGGVGWENVVLSPDGESITLRNRAWIDLSGIAKGYIVDRISSYLRKKGLRDMMVNAGGDIYCGEKAGGGKWKVGVRKPGEEGIVMVLGVRGMAVATSGDYENVVIDEKTGEAISHIIDPSTDEAKPEVPSSITVIAPTCVRADALATGMMAMGARRAIALADTLNDVEMIAVEWSEGRHAISFSGNAKKYVIKR